jgi:integrase/recombinase XerD
VLPRNLISDSIRRIRDKEEGDIPIPDSLIDLLRARRQKFPHTRFIFSSADSKADRHFLRTVKKLGLWAGMNCGCCFNKAGHCCATKPVCGRIGLHRFRKTFATMHHHAGVPIDTIRRWLRHSDLATTQAYLAGSDDKSQKTRDQVNTTFAFVKVAA